MLLCVSLVWPTEFANTLNSVQNWFDDWKFMENVRTFKFRKIGLQFLFLKIISSHTHAFCSSMSMLWVVPKCVFLNVFFLKFSEPLPVSIDLELIKPGRFKQIFNRNFDRSKNRFNQSKFWKFFIFEKQSILIQKLLKAHYLKKKNSWVWDEMFFKNTCFKPSSPKIKIFNPFPLDSQASNMFCIKLKEFFELGWPNQKHIITCTKFSK